MRTTKLHKYRDIAFSDNEKVILGIINRIQTPISRPEIAELSGLTFQSVSRIIKSLVDMNVLTETGVVKSGRGQPKVNYIINAKFAFSVGVMVGHGFVSATLLDATGVVQRSLTSSDDSLTPKETIALCQKCLSELLKAASLDWKDIIGVGISLPARIKDKKGRYLFPNHLEAWGHLDIQTEFQAVVPVPVFVGNDVVSAAIGERFCGAGKKGQDFYYLFLGQGLGSVAIENGQPKLGSHSHAGEITLLVDKDSRPTTQELQSLLRQQGILWNGYDDLEDKIINSQCVEDWCERAAETLSRLIEMIIAIIDPPRIVIGGGLNRRLVDSIVNKIELNRQTKKQEVVFDVPIQPSESEIESPSFGAAYLPLVETMFK